MSDIVYAPAHFFTWLFRLLLPASIENQAPLLGLSVGIIITSVALLFILRWLLGSDTRRNRELDR